MRRRVPRLPRSSCSSFSCALSFTSTRRGARAMALRIRSGALRRAPPVAGFTLDQFEAQGACNRRRLDQTDLDLLANLINRAGAVANHGVAGFVVAKIFVTDGARRDEAVGAGFLERDKQPARFTPLMRPGKISPMRSARCVATRRSMVSRSADHGATLAARDVGSRFGELIGFGTRHARRRQGQALQSGRGGRSGRHSGGLAR